MGANTGAVVTLSKTAQFSSCNGLGGTAAGTFGTPILTGAFTPGAGSPLGTPFNLLGPFRGRTARGT